MSARTFGVWELCFTKWFLAVRLFVGETPTDVVVAIVEKEPPAISKFLAAVPPELERIVRKALRKDPNERYQIAKEMRHRSAQLAKGPGG